MHKSLIDFKVTWKIFTGLRLIIVSKMHTDGSSAYFCCYSSGNMFFQPQQSSALR